jgi:hypothetical protein
MSTEITINQDQIDINVDTTVVTIEAPQGGYPLPNNVYSVFGRIGNVVAQEGDYTLTQLGGVTITNPLTGQALVYNGTSWVNNTETYVGTVTSVNMSVPTGLTISGNPITTAGTLALGLASGYSIPTTASQATWNTAYNDSIVSAAVTGVQTKTLTLNQQDGGTITASWTDYDTAPVTSVFGRTGAITAQSGDYNTTQVTEGTNLYFTDARARGSISAGTGISYNSTTGVISNSGVTSVGITESSAALTITGSPVTTSGNINIGFAGTSAEYVAGDGSLVTFPSIITQAQNLVTEVYNKSGATLTKGTVVYINGGQGNLPSITKAIATSDATSAQTYGIVQTDITNMNNGYVVVAGRLQNIDTQAYPEGTQLYLSSTTAGTYTSVKQYAPAHLVYVGIVVRSHPTQGIIEVKIQNGYELDELHDVSAQNPNNGDILQYVAATDLWTKTAGTTTNIAEGTNLYFTNTRARAAISETVTGLDYNNTTGVLSTTTGYGIPTTASQTNWDTAYTNRITSASAPLSIASNAISISQANTTTNGFLSSTDWNTFNNKQAAGNYITALTGEATASGPGSASVTLTNSAVIGKVLTGLNVTGGTVTATDSILAAFGKVQNQINGLIGGSIYQSVWNASTNTPTLTSSVGTKGYYYIVNVAGSTNLNGITDWKVGDWAIYDGTAWQKVDNTDAVSSVNGFTGAVSLTTDNISEGSTNLYFTNTRAQNAITLTTTGTSGAATYTSGTLNIPQYQAVLTNPVTGTGTTNTLPKFTGTSAIGNSNITDTGSLITLGSNTTISNGALGIGSTSLTNTTLRVSKNITGSNISLGIFQSGVVQSDVTSIAYSFYSAMSTAASSFTAANLLHYSATQGTIGAGSTVNLQTGFYVDSTLIGAGINYGFRGQIPSGTNRWNLYMDGTANNYMAGSLGIGRTALSNIVLGIDKNITGSTVAYGVYTGSTIQSDVTSSVAYYVTSAQTAASSFTLNNLYHYLVSQSTIGLGSTVTSQYGYHVSSNMIGATNNYAFRSQIASGTGRWNLFMDGTAANYLAGDTGIGVSQNYVSSGPILTTTLTNGGSGYVDGTYTDVASINITSAGNSALFTIVVSGGIVTSATLTWGGMSYKAGDTVTVSNTLLGGTGSGLIITINTVDSSQLTIASVNGGDISLLRNDTTLNPNDNIGAIKWTTNDSTTKASGIVAEIGAFGESTNGGASLRFYTRAGFTNSPLVEAIRISGNGGVGIGATTLAAYSLRVSKNITGGTSAFAIASDGVVQSDVTSTFINFRSLPSTAAAAFTLTSLYHFTATQGTLGAGSAITNQYGYWVSTSLTNATNNYAFYSDLGAGTNRWNLYMAGTAANYMAGDTSIGTTTGGYKLNVNGTIFSSKVTNNAAISNSPADASLLLYAPTTTNYYGGIIGWAEGNLAASISAYDDGTGGALGLSFSAGNATTLSERLRIKSTGQVRFAPLASDPSNAQAGDVYYNSTTNALKLYDGTVWRTITVI